MPAEAVDIASRIIVLLRIHGRANRPIPEVIVRYRSNLRGIRDIPKTRDRSELEPGESL